MGYQGAIFDVDGVLVDSPHELAWREALKELLDGDWRDIRDRTSWTAERFTTQVYQQLMAGKPRLAGARAALEYFGVPDVDRRSEQYADAKQNHVDQLIEQGRFRAFPDALRFILAVKNSGIRVAAASSSKNAMLLLERIRLDTFTAEQRLAYGFVHSGMTLEELFDADISGRDFARGKPDPMIFLTAAEELGLSPEVCFVIEDATSGVQAAKAGGFAAIGVARLGDQQQLADIGANLVVTTLDDVSLPALVEGRLQERQAAEEIRRRYTERPPNVWTLAYEGFDPGTPRFARGALRGGQRVLRYAWRPARGQGRRRQLSGNLCSRPLQPVDQQDRRSAGGERGPGQRPQLAPAGISDRRRSLVRHAATRRARPPPRTGYGACNADPPVYLAGRRWDGEPRWCSTGSLAGKTSTWPA